MGAERWDEQVGSVADEAGRLLESLRRSAAEAAEAAEAARESVADPTVTADSTSAPLRAPTAGDADAGGARPASGPEVDDPHDHNPAGSHDHDPLTVGAAPHDPVCQWCPICRGATVVRSLSPQTLTRLADLASVAASVLADLASARASADPAAADDPTTSDDPTAPRWPEPAASRPISVRDADDPQEAPRG